jgi:putative phage-type endonuclease
MLVHNVEQNTDEWLNLRLGIPTASEFSKLVTGTGKKSTQVTTYIDQLVAEIMLGRPCSNFTGNEHTERGHELEPHAVEYYELLNDVKTEQVGFVTDNQITHGCSPDRLVGDKGMLEIKCPADHTHVGYLLKDKVPTTYIPQVQGQMFVADREWCDWMSYHPELPSLIIRVERDEEYIKSLQDTLETVAQRTKELCARMVKLGYMDEERMERFEVAA